MDSRGDTKGGHRILYREYIMGPTRVLSWGLGLARIIDRSSCGPEICGGTASIASDMVEVKGLSMGPCSEYSYRIIISICATRLV